MAGAGPVHSSPTAGTITLRIRCRRASGNFNLWVDSTGVKMRGSKPGPGPQCGHVGLVNRWQVRRHGSSRRGPWCKVPLASDTATGDIRAVECTSGQQGDSPVLQGRPIGTVTAGGACDTRKCLTTRAGRGGTAFVGALIH